LEAMSAQRRNADELEMRSHLEQESAKKKAKQEERRASILAKAAEALNNTTSATTVSLFDDSPSDAEDLWD
jgi:hypothetical protein